MHELVSISSILICITCTCLGRKTPQARRDGIAATGPRTQLAGDDTVGARGGNRNDHQLSRVGAARLYSGTIQSLVEQHQSYSTAQGAGLNPLQGPAGLRIFGRSHILAADSLSRDTLRPTARNGQGGNHALGEREKLDRTPSMMETEPHVSQCQSDVQRTGWSDAQLAAQPSRHHPSVARNDCYVALTADDTFAHSVWFLEPPHARGVYGVIAEIVRSLWKPDAAPPRILMLGLGGGVVAGNLLTHPTRPVQSVCSVEFDQRVIELARKEFFPVMFAGKSAAQGQKHHVIHGDAFNAVDLIRNAHLGRFDFIVEDFCAYLHGGKAPAYFWNSLHKVLNNDGKLIINTHFEYEEDLDALKSELSLAGWGEFTEYVGPNIDIAEGMSQPHDDLLPRPRSSREPWKPAQNIIISARRLRRNLFSCDGP